MFEKLKNEKNLIVKPLCIILAFYLVAYLLYGFYLTEKKCDEKDYLPISDGWVNEQGEPISLDYFATEGDESTIYYTIEGKTDQSAIIFAVRNAYVDIYQDGLLLEQDSRLSSRIFGNSPGTKWHLVTLMPSDGGSVLELQCHLAYPGSNAFISDIYIGQAADLYMQIASVMMPDFLLNSMWIIFSAVLIFIYLIFKNYFKFKRDFLYLSMGAFASSVWCGVETRMWQFFFGHAEFVHLVGYMSMLLIPIPFGLLAVERLKGRWRVAAQIYSTVYMLMAITMCFLHAGRWVEFHYSLKTVHGMLVILFPLMTKVMIDYSRAQTLASMKKIMLFGYSVLVIFLSLGIVRYLMGHYSDYAIYTKIALFSLILILLVYQMTGINDVFVKGLQAEFVKDMAMLDHLTKFYNRTGFAEHRASYEESKTPLGIIQFDVNNLKRVNDEQGHEKGDELICLASSGISESFGAAGRCYRMGGDEFLIILNGKDPQTDYENGIKNFENYCGLVNTVPDRTFDLAVAHGYTLRKPGEDLSDAIETADSLMYRNKRFMKTNL